MKTLTTRKIVLGFLMAFVLVLGMQGIGEAADLPLSKTSGDLQTKSVGETFDISFTVGIRSNTTPIKNEMNRLVSEASTLIDNSGYPVFYATNGTAYRTLEIQPSDTLYRHEVGDERTTDEDPQNSWITATGTYYANSSRYIYDAEGRALYSDQGLTKRARVLETDVDDPVGHAVQYHYNQESITIALDSTGSTSGVTMTFKLKASGFQRDITALTEVPGSDPDAIPRSVTLVCTPSAVGTYKVRITDATPAADTPWTAAPSTRAFIEFTLHVVDDSASITGVTAPDDDIFYAGETLRIDDLYNLTGEAVDTRATVLLQYEVISGPGTIFERTSSRDTTTPGKNHLASRAAQIYLNLKNGNTLVRVTVSGDDPIKKGAEILFTYTGTGARRDTTTSNQNQQQNQQNLQQITPNRLSVSLSGSGDTRTVTVSALAAGTTSTSGIFTTLTSNGGTLSLSSGATPLTSTWTLPSAAGTYSVTATTTAGYTAASESVTVTVPGTLSAVQDGGTIVVTARPAPSSGLAFRLTTSGGVYAGQGEILTTGSGRAIPLLTTGSHILTVSAEGYNSTQVAFTPGARTTTDTTTTTTTTTTTPQTGTPGVADSIEIDGSRSQDGTLAEALRLRARVLDDTNSGVSGVGVTFRVLAPGRGTFAGARGSGRAIRVDTDRSGHATVNFTPTSEGDVIVEAKAAKVASAVTFIIDVGDSTTPTTPATSPAPSDSEVAPRTTEIHPVVQGNPANRPPLLWVDNGGLYTLIGTAFGRFMPSADSVMGIAVSGNKLYWTAKTGENAGTINAANLDGTGAQQLVAIRAVPRGIAVDPVAKRLYWTNSHGWIQSSNLQGTARKNVARDLSNPMDIALSSDALFWTEDNGNRFFDVIGLGSPVGLSLPNGHVGYSVKTAESLAIADGKIYWTAKTGENAGTINAANLDGTGAQQLVAIKAVPKGITVDPVAKRLYWTNSHGWIQSSNLQGKARQNVAKGLGDPSGIVVSADIKASAATSITSKPTTTTPGASKYDINGDGTVDSADVDVILLAVSAGVTLAKYDVNGDTSVDIKDVMAVNANLDAGAAGAPTLLGTQFSALAVDRLQEQVDLLIATGDRSPAAMKTLIYLQQLIAMARPEKTQLLANYPNPFNPETWMPYELATDTDVRITIYNAQGVVIRTLQLGQQSAGYYTDRERAAYWDGRNALGEQVASGVYFYQLETDEISSLRKMVILK